MKFITVNTDLQALNSTKARTKVQIGEQLTKGLGSGGRPDIGKQAAMEDTEKLVSVLEDSDMVFLTAGLGGGTGTGATPILANLAAEMDILAIAIVTLPFQFEGKIRAKQAEEGLAELKTAVDTVISIPNERLLETVTLDTSIQDAFKMADDILRQAAQGISDLITRPGLINLDFADVKSIMKGMGMAFMGTGLASGENRAADAAQKAISSPLLVELKEELVKLEVQDANLKIQNYPENHPERIKLITQIKKAKQDIFDITFNMFKDQNLHNIIDPITQFQSYFAERFLRCRLPGQPYLEFSNVGKNVSFRTGYTR